MRAGDEKETIKRKRKRERKEGEAKEREEKQVEQGKRGE